MKIPQHGLTNEHLLILSLTRRCNLACKYCKPESGFTYDKLSSSVKKKSYSDENFYALRELCKKINVTEVVLTGGEPTEYEDFFKIIRFFMNNKITFSIHTNGTSEKWNAVLDFLKSHKLLLNIDISIELFDELQKEIRGSDIPYRLIKNLTNIGCNVNLKVTIHNKLLPYVDDLENALNKYLVLGVKSIRIQPVFFPKNISDALKLTKESSKIFKKFLDLKQLEKFSSFIRNSTESLLLIIDFLQYADMSRIKKVHCSAKDKVVFMGPDGKIINCLELWNKKSCAQGFDLACCCFII